MNNPFDYIPTGECDEAFEKLIERLEAMKRGSRTDEVRFVQELEKGKMLGVLIAADDSDVKHTLYAFSGQAGDQGFHFHGFVEPVLDYLKPDGYFKKKEAEISRLNKEISEYDQSFVQRKRIAYSEAEEIAESKIAAYKEQCRLSKLRRKAKRESGPLDKDEAVSLIRQSQYEKAELRRLKKRMATALEPTKNELAAAQSCLSKLKKRRKEESEALQAWLFSNFTFLNSYGQSKSLLEIFSDTSTKIPPSGAGECCAPKLLQAAYKKGYKPLAMAEYWYGKPIDGDVRRSGEYYPACRGKCLPILRWMLKGLSITPPLDMEKYGPPDTPCPTLIYENEWFCVVEKPAGILSAPGKSPAPSVQQWLADRYGPDKEVRVAHRLDQATSGLLIATFGSEAHKQMQALFARREVIKTYVALLDGDYRAKGIPRKGRIELGLSPDILDRPRQRIDCENGKESITDYEFISAAEELSRINFHPHTGRTHQLRLHAASRMGLGMPIAGDSLYGLKRKQSAGRLLLHAHKIEFTFPAERKKYIFESPVPF